MDFLGEQFAFDWLSLALHVAHLRCARELQQMLILETCCLVGVKKTFAVAFTLSGFGR